MKVLHVIPAVAARYGGPSQAISELVTALRQQDVTAEVCTTDADGPGRLPVELGKPVEYLGNPFHFFRCDGSEALKYSRDLQRWLTQHVADYDLLHIHAVFSHSVYAAARACQRAGIPYIVRPAGTIEPWSMAQKRPRKLVAWHLFLRQALNRAAAIHYTTNQERELTEGSLHLCRGLVVPNGVDSTLLEASDRGNFRRQLGLASDTPFLFCLSRLHPKKGLDLLLKNFVALKTQNRLANWHLVIAGDGEAEYVARLRALLTGTAAEAFVHWPGWLQGEAKRDALAEADLFVLSSHQENFGIGPVEAMACGTPVLLSRQVGLATEVREHGAGWIVELTGEDLCRGLLEATGDSAARKTRGAAARALVRDRFTWPRIAATWCEHYAAIISSCRNK